MPVSFAKNGSIALVTLDAAPVNAIGRAERQGLADALHAIKTDTGITAVVLSGEGRAFAAGADAREFDGPPLEPHLPAVADAMEASTVPWIAAMRGPALGGGCELALACHYRIGAPDLLIGLPEVTLGVVPGSGGTQRLPRLVGLGVAASLVAEGRTIKAEEALKIGLIDRIADDPVAAAIALAHAGDVKIDRISARPSPESDDAAIEAVREKVKKRMAGQEAPLLALDLVALTTTLPFSEGAQRERATFLERRQSVQAKALRHIFFAERNARPPAEAAKADKVEVKRVVVVGGGTMGAGIAYALLLGGYGVAIIETDVDAVERARANIGKIFTDSLKRGLITEEKAEKLRAQLDIRAGYDDLSGYDLAIEAAFEDMAVKRAIFGQLDAAMPAHAILATNTSYLDVNEIAASTKRPESVIGLHFFSPAHVMKLLEIVRAEKTSASALATGFTLAQKLKKIPVIAGVCDGFIGNRILARYREQADMLLLDGSVPWEIDEAMVEFGYAMGPYMAQDLSGLDIAYANRKRKAATRDPNRRYVKISDRMVAEGRLGRKASVGWYRYPGGGGPVVDPLLEDMMREEAHFAKVTRQHFSHEDIRRRLLAAMIGEAAAILNEGIAEKAADIDLVMVAGYGFPRWRGGLMHYAREYGFDRVLSDIREFAKEDPVVWAVPKALERLAEEG